MNGRESVFPARFTGASRARVGSKEYIVNVEQFENISCSQPKVPFQKKCPLIKAKEMRLSYNRGIPVLGNMKHHL